MSMMPVREAMRQLESAGVIEHVPHRGARVREMSQADLIDTYRTRMALEGLLCRTAVNNAG
jgi:DNA-binding GntR family transcriptional regulator